MKFLFAAALVAATTVFAQNNTVNTTVLNDLADALQQAGLGSLSSILTKDAASSDNGQMLLQFLTDGQGNKTIFAPSNDALSNQTVVTAFELAYHVAAGPYGNNSYFYTSPNDTIIRTRLNDTSLVHLEGNHSQVLVASVKDGQVAIKNPDGSSVEVTKFSTHNNFDIVTINGVLTPPGDIDSVLKNNGLTSFIGALQQGGIYDAVKNASGITLFAPSNEAIDSALSKLGPQAANQTLIDILLGNHIINGTSVYSTQFDDNWTSGSGETFKFNITQNSTSIGSGDSGNFTANITRIDLIAKNGVVHIIDNVLANTQNDTNAAGDAYSSVSSAAANPTATESTPVGGAPPTSPAGGAVELQIPIKGVSLALAAVVFGTLIL